MTQAGAIERLSANVWRVALPCATLPPFDHVNAYVVAHGEVAVVIDPGSSEATALPLLESALGQAGARLVKAVLLTHTHDDHTAGVNALLVAEARRSGTAPPVMLHAAEAAAAAPGWPVTILNDDRVLTVGSLVLRALHTPGHSPGHLSFTVEAAGEAQPQTVLVGDLAVASGSVWVGLPEGNVADYLKSLERLAGLSAPVIGPGHGPLITNPTARLAELAAHRRERELQILATLRGGATTTEAIVQRLYPDQPAAVQAFARQSVLAHLVKLMNEMQVLHLGSDEDGPFVLRELL